MQRINGIKILVVVALLIATLVTAVEAEPPQPQPLQADESGAGLYIHLKAGSFDPLQAPLDLPKSLTYAPAEAARAGVYIVQFEGPVMPAWKGAVLEAGGQLGHYLPDYAFLAKLDPDALERVEDLAFVRWVGPYQPAYKLAPDVDYNDTRSYRVVLAPWMEAEGTQTALNGLTSQARAYQGGFSAVLSGEQLDQAARLADVVWIEPVYLQRLHNDVGGGTIMGGSTAWSSGYTGDGVTICVADTGLDTGNAGSIHQDFSGRVAHLSSWPVLYTNYGGGCVTENDGADDGASDVDSGHGTHVTGSVAGDGARSSGQFKGLAYEASITMQAVEQYTNWSDACLPYLPDGYYLTGIPDDPGDLLQQAYDWGARIHNNSWGGGEFGVYDQQSAYFDAFLHDKDDMLVVTSAGNSGEDADNDGYVDEDSVSSPASAKNVLTVGASDNERSSGGISGSTWAQRWPDDFDASPTGNDLISDDREELAAFSSRGPMADGRLKPDVVAPGTDILSVRSSLASSDGWGAYDDYYMYMGGTSMASPLTAGAAAVVRDYYIDAEGHANPSAALIKATLINSAVDVSGYGNASQEAGQPIPNNHEGWGRVDVAAATTPDGRTFVDETTGVNTGDTQTYSYEAAGGQPFKVSLVWSDHPGAAEATLALVNDLNLRLTAPDGSTQYWGNVFSGGWSQTGGSADSVNNVENVYVQSPTAGTWTVEVIGQNVPQGSQPFALVVSGVSEALAVSSINPSFGYQGEVAHITNLAGSSFKAGVAISLTRSGETDIVALNVQVVNAGKITCDFDLTGAALGMWTVELTQEGNTVTLPDGFQVTQPQETLYMPIVIRNYPPLPPGAPTLNGISDPEGDGNYTVSWSASSGATGYTLQEASNASFSSPTTAYSGSSTSTSITGQSQGTYYYRVNASNSIGTSGWSNVQSVTVAPPLPSTFYSVADATILQGLASTNFGSTRDMWAGYEHCSGSSNGVTRSLVKFDLSAIPQGTQIAQATLSLYHANYCDIGNRTHSVTTYRIANNWSESSVNWNNQPSLGEPFGSASITSGAWGRYTFDVTTLVQAWVNGTRPNYGVMVRGPESSGNDSARLGFYTRDEGGTDYDPYLTITYSGMSTVQETVSAVNMVPGSVVYVQDLLDLSGSEECEECDFVEGSVYPLE